MRRLHIDQTVNLSLDDESGTIQCRVLEVQGVRTRLAPRGGMSARMVGRLVNGWPGFLVFQQFRVPIGLRVAVRTNPPYIDVAIMDGVGMPERRSAERVRVATPVRVVSAGVGEHEPSAAWTETINLSENGALLRDHAAFASGQRFSLGLMFGEDPQPITAAGEVARRLRGGVGVTFDAVAADDATRLREYLAGLRHQRTGR